jgi:hypothetical protein
MSKHIQVQEPITLRNYVTDEPVEGGDNLVSFARSVRMALAAIQSKMSTPGPETKLDMLQLLDIRRAFDKAKVGSFVEIRDNEYELIKAEVLRPGAGFHPLWGTSAESHIRAFTEAKSELPLVMKSESNGSAEAQAAS